MLDVLKCSLSFHDVRCQERGNTFRKSAHGEKKCIQDKYLPGTSADITVSLKFSSNSAADSKTSTFAGDAIVNKEEPYSVAVLVSCIRLM
jgi:hypothetical protein